MIASVYDPPTNIAGYDPIATAGDCWFDADCAATRVEFFPDCLRHSKGRYAGKPFVLEQWQKDVVATIFGWKNADGWRRYRTVFIFVARKNGKTELAAGLATMALFTDGENGAQCYCTGHEKEQASLLFDAAKQQVLQCEALRRNAKVIDSKKRIVFKKRGSFFRALPANESGGHGFNTHFVAYDEFHLYLGRKHREVYESLHTSTGNRDQPLEVVITTAGYDKMSLCHEMYEYAKSVRDGRIEDPSFLPVIYEVEQNDDWNDRDNWKKANPSLGVTISTDYLEREFLKAQQNPAYENTFRRLHLNQWTQQANRWLSMDAWDRCPASEEPIADRAVCYGGLDLSSTIDLTAWMLLSRVGDLWKCWGHYWVPKGRVEFLERKHNIPIQRWVQEGWVTVVPGERISYGAIRDRIVADSERVDLHEVGYDPYNAQETTEILEVQHGIRMVAVRQGALSLSGPAKELERLVAEGLLDHSLDPVLRWMAENVEVVYDRNANPLPVKADGSQRNHIDGIMGLIMALAQGLVDQRGPSIYETAGALGL